MAACLGLSPRVPGFISLASTKPCFTTLYLHTPHIMTQFAGNISDLSRLMHSARCSRCSAMTLAQSTATTSGAMGPAAMLSLLFYAEIARSEECPSIAGNALEPLLVRAARGEKVERAPCWCALGPSHHSMLHMHYRCAHHGPYSLQVACMSLQDDAAGRTLPAGEDQGAPYAGRYMHAQRMCS